MNSVLIVLNEMYDNEQNPEYASPHCVVNYAKALKVRLSSDDVVFISDIYGTNDCPTGRRFELNQGENHE